MKPISRYDHVEAVADAVKCCPAHNSAEAFVCAEEAKGCAECPITKANEAWTAWEWKQMEAKRERRNIKNGTLRVYAIGGPSKGQEYPKVWADTTYFVIIDLDSHVQHCFYRTRKTHKGYRVYEWRKTLDVRDGAELRDKAGLAIWHKPKPEVKP